MCQSNMELHVYDNTLTVEQWIDNFFAAVFNTFAFTVILWLSRCTYN